MHAAEIGHLGGSGGGRPPAAVVPAVLLPEPSEHGDLVLGAHGPHEPADFVVERGKVAARGSRTSTRSDHGCAADQDEARREPLG